MHTVLLPLPLLLLPVLPPWNAAAAFEEGRLRSPACCRTGGIAACSCCREPCLPNYALLDPSHRKRMLFWSPDQLAYLYFYPGKQVGGPSAGGC